MRLNVMQYVYIYIVNIPVVYKYILDTIDSEQKQDILVNRRLRTVFFFPRILQNVKKKEKKI